MKTAVNQLIKEGEMETVSSLLCLHAPYQESEFIEWLRSPFKPEYWNKLQQTSAQNHQINLYR